MYGFSKSTVMLTCVATLVIGGVGAWWGLSQSLRSSDQKLSEPTPEVDETSENINDQPSSEEPFSSRRKATQEPGASNAEASEKLYGANVNLVESWRSVATEHGWSYDDLMDNLSLWESLCSDVKPGGELQYIDGVRGISQTGFDRIGRFCEGFDQWGTTELSEYDFVNEPEVLAENTEYHEMIEKLSELPEGRQLEQLIHALENALDQYNEAWALDVVGYLVFTDLVSPPARIQNESESPQQLNYNLQSVLATTAILMCEQLGGCGYSHPLVYRLCTQIIERNCFNPGNIYEAASQVLTGLEAELVVHLLTRIDQLRARYSPG